MVVASGDDVVVKGSGGRDVNLSLVGEKLIAPLKVSEARAEV